MKINVLHLLSACAALALALGIGMTALSARQEPLAAQRLKGRAATLGELQALQRDQERCREAVRMFAALSNAAPASLAELASAAVTNMIPDIRELDSKALTPEWTLRRAEVTFNEMDLERLPAFLRAAESRRPPWRLAECAIAASTQADGHGRVILTLEVIVKTGKQELLK